MIQTDTPTQGKLEKVAKQEVFLYHIVGRGFEGENIYAMGGTRPNAKHIAGQYGVELEVRCSKFVQTGIMNYIPSYLARYGIHDGECLSVVLIGEDREQLHKAKRDIHQTFGVGSFDAGDIDVGRERKTVFS